MELGIVLATASAITRSRPLICGARPGLAGIVFSLLGYLAPERARSSKGWTTTSLDRGRVLEALDVARLRGIEVGAAHQPVVRRGDGDIQYVDHASTEELRRKYANDPGVDLAALVEVDAVWGAQTLAEAVGVSGRYNYVVASHVAEHVPDLLGWLEEVAEVLTQRARCG